MVQTKRTQQGVYEGFFADVCYGGRGHLEGSVGGFWVRVWRLSAE